MIAKNEVLRLAKSLNLRPETVEKDYVLSWMLFGVNANQNLREKWMFKGGTSLKKCFFETFRFSEDLDFTLSDPIHFNKQFLLREFHKIADLLYEETGIEFVSNYCRCFSAMVFNLPDLLCLDASNTKEIFSKTLLTGLFNKRFTL